MFNKEQICTINLKFVSQTFNIAITIQLYNDIYFETANHFFIFEIGFRE